MEQAYLEKRLSVKKNSHQKSNGLNFTKSILQVEQLKQDRCQRSIHMAMVPPPIAHLSLIHI